MKNNKTFSIEKKIQILQELVEGKDTINQLAGKYRISVNELNNWKKVFERPIREFTPQRKGIIVSMRERWKLCGTIMLAGLFFLTLAVVAIKIDDLLVNQCINISLLVAGACCGWLVGTIISPYTESESKEFTTYAKAITAFISGYVVSKIDKTVETVFASELLLTPLNGFRVISFTAVFVIAMLVTFILRRYA